MLAAPRNRPAGEHQDGAVQRFRQETKAARRRSAAAKCPWADGAIPAPERSGGCCGNTTDPKSASYGDRRGEVTQRDGSESMKIGSGSPFRRCSRPVNQKEGSRLDREAGMQEGRRERWCHIEQCDHRKQRRHLKKTGYAQEKAPTHQLGCKPLKSEHRWRK